MTKPKTMAVPADLRRRIEDEASAMGVPPMTVLRAAIELGLNAADENDLVLAVQDVLAGQPVVPLASLPPIEASEPKRLSVLTILPECSPLTRGGCSCPVGTCWVEYARSTQQAGLGPLVRESWEKVGWPAREFPCRS